MSGIWNRHMPRLAPAGEPERAVTDQPPAVPPLPQNADNHPMPVDTYTGPVPPSDHPMPAEEPPLPPEPTPVVEPETGVVSEPEPPRSLFQRLFPKWWPDWGYLNLSFGDRTFVNPDDPQSSQPGGIEVGVVFDVSDHWQFIATAGVTFGPGDDTTQAPFGLRQFDFRYDSREDHNLVVTAGVNSIQNTLDPTSVVQVPGAWAQRAYQRPGLGTSVMYLWEDLKVAAAIFGTATNKIGQTITEYEGNNPDNAKLSAGLTIESPKVYFDDARQWYLKMNGDGIADGSSNAAGVVSIGIGHRSEENVSVEVGAFASHTSKPDNEDSPNQVGAYGKIVVDLGEDQEMSTQLAWGVDPDNIKKWQREPINLGVSFGTKGSKPWVSISCIYDPEDKTLGRCTGGIDPTKI